MRLTSNLYKALSDQSRLRILMMLQERSLCVCEIVDILGLANSTVSKHLSILRNTDLIMDEKDGRWVNYRLSTSLESNLISGVMKQLNELLLDDKIIQQDHQALAEVDRFHICST